MNLLSPIKHLFGYDAARNTGRRQAPRVRLRSEDDELRPHERRKLTATTRDIQRNFSIAAWAVRKHLDFCASFTFQSRSGDPALDQRIEALMEWWGRPQNCDVAGRHGLRRMIRLAEARRTVDGDVFLLKLSGGRIQAIEGDRVHTPTTGSPPDFDRSDWTHGIQITAAGRAKAYCVCDRHASGTGGGFVYRATIPSRHMLHHAFFDRFDQVRGISPIASAINTLQDTYESFDHALAKAKVSQIFGLAFYRDGAEQLAPLPGEQDDNAEDPPPYEVDFSQGPQVLDLEPGDRAEFLESRTPSTEFRDFTQTMIAVALKALDIPFSFFDESFTNFYGSRGALMQYLKSCEAKREDLRNLLDQITAWRLSLFIEDGVLELPRGMTVQDLKWDWVPAGLPWWDPAKEVRGDVMAIAAGLTTRTQILKERGRGEFRDVIDKLAEEEQYIKEKGVAVDMAA